MCLITHFKMKLDCFGSQKNKYCEDKEPLVNAMLFFFFIGNPLSLSYPQSLKWSTSSQPMCLLGEKKGNPEI